MRRFRNPRFAPEALERKLNPSTTMDLAVVAEVMPAPGEEVTLSEPEPMYVDYGTCEESEVCQADTISYTDTDIPRPGDPEPINPTPVPPPDGSGDPPIGSPSFPGGPGEPA